MSAAEEPADAGTQPTERAEESSVRVALRVRPMLPTDLADGASECVFTTPGEPMLFLGSDRAFTFDHVFGTRATQPEIYEQIRVGPMVRSALSGLNATVFAYGQTGSGKTHTMGTANIDLERSDETTGILPRAMRELFGAVTERLDAGESLKVRVSATFIEIHREEVHDLLHGLGVSERDGTGQAAADEFVPGGRPVTAPANGSAHSAGGSAAGSSGGGVTIREDPSGAIALAGARQRMLRSAADALRCVQQGALLRATASTAMNATSSRSHAVLTVTVETDLPPLGGQTGGKPRALSAKLHFVDLAGSERAKRTKAEGERLQEGIHINRGLLALGNVICALTAERKAGAHVHVPYRESKLTRLLQDSLGGNSQTVMVACVSPCDADFEETLNTLKYAHRARQIQNKPVVNVDLERADAAQLRLQVRSLQAQLAAAAAAGAVPRAPTGMGGATGMADAGAFARRCEQLEGQLAAVRAQLARAGAEIGRLHARALAAEAGAGGVAAAQGGQPGLPPVAAAPEAAAAGASAAAADGAGEAGSAEERAAAELLLASEPELIEADMAFAERQRRMAAQLDALTESLAAKEQIAARFDVLRRRPARPPAQAVAAGGEGGAEAHAGGGGESEEGEGAPPDGSEAEAEVARLAQVIEAMAAEKEGLLGALAALSGEHAAGHAAVAGADEGARGGGEDAKGAGAMRERLRSLEASLEGARKKLAAAEALLRARASSEARLGHLQAEIREMRAVRVSLMKQMRAAAAEHAAHRRARELELLQARRAEQRMAAQLSKVAGAAERQATVLKQKMGDLSAAHAKLREKEAQAAAAARQNRIHAQLKPPLPARPATASGGSGAAHASGALTERAGPAGGGALNGLAGGGVEGSSAAWLVRAAEVGVALAQLRAQLAGHVGARRQAKRELDELDLISHPFRSAARAAAPAAGEGGADEEGAGGATADSAADADARRDALRSELAFRSDKVSELQRQIVALDKESAAHESRLAAAAAAPQRAGSALALALKLAVDARAAEEASTLRVAEAQASLRDAVELAEGLGAQLDSTRAEHARALLAAEGAHQQALSAVVDAGAAGVASAPPARSATDDAAAAKAKAQAAAAAVAEAEAVAREALDEAAELRVRVAQLEARLERAQAELQVAGGATAAAMPAGDKAATSGKLPAKQSVVGARAREAGRGPAAAAAAKAKGVHGRAARVVVSDGDEEEQEEKAHADGVASAKEAPAAAVESAGASPKEDEEEAGSDEASEDSEEEEDDDDDDEGSDVDWMETEEARHVIPKTQRARRGAAPPSPRSHGRGLTAAARESTGSSSEARSAAGGSPAVELDAQPLRITTRRRANSTMPAQRNSGKVSPKEEANAGAGDATQDATSLPSAASVLAEKPRAAAAALLKPEAEQPQVLQPAQPKRAPLGTLTNRAGGNAPAASGAAKATVIKPAPASGAPMATAAPPPVASDGTGIAPPRRKGLYSERAAKSDMSALFAANK